MYIIIYKVSSPVIVIVFVSLSKLSTTTTHFHLLKEFGHQTADRSVDRTGRMTELIEFGSGHLSHSVNSPRFVQTVFTQN